jgi:hypothetical protein
MDIIEEKPSSHPCFDQKKITQEVLFFQRFQIAIPPVCKLVSA